MWIKSVVMVGLVAAMSLAAGGCTKQWKEEWNLVSASMSQAEHIKEAKREINAELKELGPRNSRPMPVTRAELIEKAMRERKAELEKLEKMMQENQRRARQ